MSDLPGYWNHRSTPLSANLLRQLVDLVQHQPPPNDYTVLPAGIPRSRLFQCPFRVRTSNCLQRAYTENRLQESAPTTVRDLVALPNFGIGSLIDFMCVVEAGLESRFLSTLGAGSVSSIGQCTVPSSPDPVPILGGPSIAGQALERIFAAAQEFRGAQTLSDALKGDLSSLASALGVAGDLDDIPITDVVSGPSLSEEVLGAISGVRESKSQSTAAQLTIEHRIVDSPPKSLEEVGKEVNLSRERIRQLEKTIRAALESTVGGRLRGITALIGEQLAPVIPEAEFEERIRSTFPPGVAPGTSDASEADLAIARQLLRDALGYSCEDGVCINAEATAILDTLRSTAKKLADDAGLVDEHGLQAYLPGDAWLPHWDVLIDRIPLHRLSGRLARPATAKAKAATVKAKAKAALLQIGKPATKEEIAEVAELTLDQVRAQMYELPSIVRADKIRWGLAEWVDDEFEGIAAEIIQRINEDGGATRLTRLLDELPRKFGVSESSVRAYTGTPRFLLQDGYVSLADPSSIALRHLDHVVDGRTVDGSPYWCFKVEARYLDGHSVVGVPPEFVKALGCEPDGNIRIPISSPSGCRQLSASWPLSSLSGSSIGYLADPLSHLGAGTGDRVCLAIERGPSVSLSLGEPDGSRGSSAHESPIEPAPPADDPSTDRAQQLLEQMKQRRRGL